MEEHAIALTCPTFLQSESLEDLSKLLMLADTGQLDMDTGTETGSQVGWAGQNISQVLIPHELMSLVLEE